jgi:hypothetical protein
LTVSDCEVWLNELKRAKQEKDLKEKEMMKNGHGRIKKTIGRSQRFSDMVKEMSG